MNNKVIFIQQVSDVQCDVSYPTSVFINISCGDHRIIEERNITDASTCILTDRRCINSC